MLPADFAGDFQIAVSDRLVTNALYEAWRGGLMRRLLADQSLSINLAGDGAAGQGILEDTRVRHPENSVAALGAFLSPELYALHVEGLSKLDGR